VEEEEREEEVISDFGFQISDFVLPVSPHLTLPAMDSGRQASDAGFHILSCLPVRHAYVADFNKLRRLNSYSVAKHL
jgi:hypothetical protein